VAQRELVDADGVRWLVWAVMPSLADRRELPDRRVDPRPKRERRTRREVRVHMEPGMAKGWLVFESAHEKRRLHPIPESWASLDDASLATLLREAVPAAHARRRLIE
jgi:hypothetical protein